MTGANQIVAYLPADGLCSIPLAGRDDRHTSISGPGDPASTTQFHFRAWTKLGVRL
jgi:hypothetical protein